MNRTEHLITALALSGVSPIIGFLAGWWGALPLVPEHRIWLLALVGLLVGIAIDVIWLRRWVRRAASLPWWVWGAIYGFYAVGIYGLFMGVPVFNAGLALPAGALVGFRLARSGTVARAVTQATRRTCAFTTGVLALFCTASAFLALTDRSTAANLEGMLGLRFDVTPTMILGLILLGGAALLVVEWWGTAFAIRWAHAGARVNTAQ